METPDFSIVCISLTVDIFKQVSWKVILYLYENYIDERGSVRVISFHKEVLNKRQVVKSNNGFIFRVMIYLQHLCLTSIKYSTI